MEWRPDGWVKNRNIYMERNQPKPPHYKSRQNDYEAGANAILETLCKEVRHQEAIEGEA